MQNGIRASSHHSVSWRQALLYAICFNGVLAVYWSNHWVYSYLRRLFSLQFADHVSLVCNLLVDAGGVPWCGQTRRRLLILRRLFGWFPLLTLSFLLLHGEQNHSDEFTYSHIGATWRTKSFWRIHIFTHCCYMENKIIHKHIQIFLQEKLPKFVRNLFKGHLPYKTIFIWQNWWYYQQGPTVFAVICTQGGAFCDRCTSCSFHTRFSLFKYRT